MTQYFSYDYIKNYVESRIKKNPELSGPNVNYPEFDDQEDKTKFDDKTGQIAFDNFVSMLQDD